MNINKYLIGISIIAITLSIYFISHYALGVSIGGNLNMSGNRIINLGTPTNPDDAATQNYVASTDAATRTYVDQQVAAAIEQSRPQKHYFTTVTSYTGDLGGLSGCDAKCNNDSNRIPGKIYACVRSENWGAYQQNPNTYYNNYYGIQDRSVLYNKESDYFWATMRTTDCNSWTSGSEYLIGFVGDIDTTDTIGTASLAASTYCGKDYKLLCIEQ